MTRRVEYDERAISQAAAFPDDPQGIREVLDAIDQLADDPRSTGSFPHGSPDPRRLRIGRYRVLYEITEDAVAIRASPVWHARRLSVARCFARYLSATDPSCQVQPAWPLPARYSRVAPYIYTQLRAKIRGGCSCVVDR